MDGANLISHRLNTDGAYLISHRLNMDGANPPTLFFSHPIDKTWMVLILSPIELTWMVLILLSHRLNMDGVYIWTWHFLYTLLD